MDLNGGPQMLSLALCGFDRNAMQDNAINPIQMADKMQSAKVATLPIGTVYRLAVQEELLAICQLAMPRRSVGRGRSMPMPVERREYSNKGNRRRL